MKYTNFTQYLYQLKHTNQTVESYVYVVERVRKEVQDIDQMTYQEVLHYFAKKHEMGVTSGSRAAALHGLKKYFDFLVESGIREDHPCKRLFIRNMKDRAVLMHDLFSSSELELLLDQPSRYEILRDRNQVILSLLIYQGLLPREISALTLDDIDLDNGLVRVKSGTRVSSRSMEMHLKQVRLFDQYLQRGRRQLNRFDRQEFVLGKLGTSIKTEDIHYLVSTFQYMFGDKRISPMIIRKSVISNWLNEKKIPLDQVQLISGQKWISSTQRYQQRDISEQRDILNKFFPLD